MRVYHRMLKIATNEQVARLNKERKIIFTRKQRKLEGEIQTPTPHKSGQNYMKEKCWS